MVGRRTGGASGTPPGRATRARRTARTGRVTRAGRMTRPKRWARLGYVAVLITLAGCSSEPPEPRQPESGSVPRGGGVDSTASSAPGFANREGRLDVSTLLGRGDTTGYARAVEPRSFEFPADHGPHPRFRTEWWYLTGNLTEAGADASSERRFGYQFTVFRVALAPGAPEGPSDWRTNQAYMAHFAVTDAGGGRFLNEERFARGALGLAGARADPFRVWLDDWTLRAADEETAFPARLEADTDSFSVSLLLEGGKEPVLQGREGLSPKGPGYGNASYYYSLTRMPTEGTITVGGDTLRVEGTSWMDREWSTSALGPGVEGWDWFSIQLDDDHELMYYQLRREDGSPSPLSAGTWVEPDGSYRTLASPEVELSPVDRWESPEGEVSYPVSWEISVPSEGLEVTVEALLRDQEWRSAFRYWEGAVEVRGSLDGEIVGGRGYVELTGYGGAIPGGFDEGG